MSAQSPEIIDTMVLGKDSIVVYNNKSWEYLRMLNFDGVTNSYLDSLVKYDSAYMWIDSWNNNEAYISGNDLSLMPDTLWLCSVDSNHSKFCMPHPGMVTSKFKYRGSRFHYGIDVDLITGDTLVAAFDGVVRYAKYNKSGFGNLVVIRHYNGLETYYAHLDKLLVSANQEVKAGEVIGLGGKTGRAYGDHLHFEIRLYGNALDPEEVIDFENKCIKDENLLIHRGWFDYLAISTNKRYKTIHPKEGEISDAPTVKYHKIKKGDSLYAIAIKYKTSVNAICELNGISPNKTLAIGEVVQIRP